MNSEKYELVKKYYKTHLWTEQRTRNAVDKGWITTEEFKDVTGKEY